MNLVTFILGSIPQIIQQYADYFRAEDLQSTLAELNTDLNLPRIQTYDYIVVGGGSAGCIMAGRLSEMYSVLLVESGGDPVPATYVQYFTRDYVKYHPAINNIFYSTKQERFSLQTDGIFQITHGRMLGGSASHNDNVYNRGSPKDYDTYARLTEDNSWSYENVLKYFKKLENYVGSLIDEGEREEYYGSGGPINVITADQPPRLLPQWLKAGQKLEYSVKDPNGHQSEGFSPIAVSTSGGEKDDSYISYIKPFDHGIRTRLTVLRYSVVEKVLINDNNAAYGVLYKRHGIPQIAHASQEVILSAGSISSPILLIKSGIGSKTILEKAKIPVIVDHPGVGQNYRQHCGVYLYFNLKHLNQTLLPQITEANVEEELIKFQSGSSENIEDRKGIFATSFSMGQAFLVSSIAKGDGEEDWPDLQLWLRQRSYRPIEAEGNRSIEGQDFLISVALNRQKSVGELIFNTTAYLNGERNDTKLVVVNNRLLSEESDIIAIMDGIKVILKVVENTEAFEDAEYVDTIPEPCKRFTHRSDEYWKCFIEQKSTYWNHGMGTAKMGAAHDLEAVVDSKLRVRGVTGLRVVDASVFPLTPNANINSAIMMAAEKISDEIMTARSS